MVGPSRPSQLVLNPFNWSPKTVFYRNLRIGRSNKNDKKTKSIYIRILLLGGPSPSSQLVPKNCFLQISQYRSLKSKKSIFFFKFLLLGGPSPPSQLVPNPFNWSPNTVFYRYLSNGRSNWKLSKNGLHFFSRILLLGGPSPPSQLVPNPFNWSSNTVFYRYLSIGRSNQKKSKT